MDLLKQVNDDFEEMMAKTDPAEQMQTLAEKMAEKGMQMHGEAFPTYLKPYFVDAGDRNFFGKTTQLMISSLNKIGDAYFQEGAFKKQIQISGRTAELANIDAGYPGHQIVNRLDVFYIPETGELKYLEFNCGDPSGMGWHDNLLEMFLELPVIKELQKKYEVIVDWLVKSHFTIFLRKYRQWCENKGIEPLEKPNIAFVCWNESTILSDFLSFVEYYKQMGHNAHFADPRDFDYDGKTLTLKGQPIHLIYRDALDDFILDEFWEKSQPVLNAYREGNVCFVNPVSAATGDWKSILEILSDPQYDSIFSPEEREAHRKHIPWTRTLLEGKTDYKGKEIDLVSFVRNHKNEFVLKPNDGYGGFGILVGISSNQREWEDLMEKSFREGTTYTAQELVNIPKEKFPVMEGDKLQGFEDKNVNINFWSHDGNFAGSFVRAAAGTIINIHQGGGLVPVFYVKPK